MPGGLFYGIIWFYIFAINTIQLTWPCKFMSNFSIETQTRWLALGRSERDKSSTFHNGTKNDVYRVLHKPFQTIDFIFENVSLISLRRFSNSNTDANGGVSEDLRDQQFLPTYVHKGLQNSLYFQWPLLASPGTTLRHRPCIILFIFWIFQLTCNILKIVPNIRKYVFYFIFFLGDMIFLSQFFLPLRTVVLCYCC